MYVCMYVCMYIAFSQRAAGPSSVCEGNDVTLQCVIVINPGNTVQSSVWSRDGMPVQVINSSGLFTLPNHNQVFNSTTGGFTDLVITNVTLEDDNTVYSCSATGAPITSNVVLNVIGNNVHVNIRISIGNTNVSKILIMYLITKEAQ